MLALLAAFAASSQIPVGSYGLPQLCDLLTQATGVVHLPGKLRDYPVFVGVKSGDPKRVETLVAKAVRAEWSSENGKLKLFPVKPEKNDGLQEFKRLYLKACPAGSPVAQIPPEEMYALQPGRIQRYSHLPNSFTKPLPLALEKSFESSDRKDGDLVIRRVGYGAFESRIDLPNSSSGPFDPSGSFQIEGLPAEVESLLGDSLNKPAFGKEEQAALQKIMQPGGLKIDWLKIEKNDPIAAMGEKLFVPSLHDLSADIVTAEPDLMPMLLSGVDLGTVGHLLATMSGCVQWKIVDGAAVGVIPATEWDLPTQTDRSVLQSLISAVQDIQVVDLTALAQYVENQRPGASETWCDAVMLVMAGLTVDEEDIGDYPFNERFFTKLTEGDWRLLRSGRPFPASDLSPGSQTALGELLLQARSRLDGGDADPAFWKSLDAPQIVLNAEIKSESVLIHKGAQYRPIRSVPESAADYQMEKDRYKLEPLYFCGARQQVKLTIACALDQKKVTTGFSSVSMTGGAVATTWDKLPPAISAQFRQELAHSTYVAPVVGATGSAVAGGGTTPPR